MGEYLEGVGDEVILALTVVFAVVLSTIFILYKLNFFDHTQVIHPESQESVNLARSHLQINLDNTNGDTSTVIGNNSSSTSIGAHNGSNGSINANVNNDPGGNQAQTTTSSATETQRRFYSDRVCPICLLEAQYAVETNCGHLFCGRCIITYWRFGNWLGTVQCPVCRQMVSLMMRDFAVEETDECSEIVQEINDYNRRFSGQPRPFMDYIRDLPALLRHLWREFFSVGGLVMMFRFRIVLCLVAVLAYLLSPLDILPEALFGVIGFLDDIFILLLVLIYVTIIYRQVVAERAQE